MFYFFDFYSNFINKNAPILLINEKLIYEEAIGYNGAGL